MDESYACDGVMAGSSTVLLVIKLLLLITLDCHDTPVIVVTGGTKALCRLQSCQARRWWWRQQAL
jgi:hypothetical protein